VDDHGRKGGGWGVEHELAQNANNLDQKCKIFYVSKTPRSPVHIVLMVTRDRIRTSVRGGGVFKMDQVAHGGGSNKSVLVECL